MLWYLERNPDGSYTLTAPNGIVLFIVNIETLCMLADMFLDELGEDYV